MKRYQIITVLAVALFSGFYGCSNLYLGTIKKVDRLKFPVNDTVKTCRNLRYDGVYFYCKNDTIRPHVYMYFRPDGSVYLGFDDSGVFKQCGDSVVAETYRKFGGLVGRWVMYKYVIKFPDSTRAVAEFRGLPMELYHKIEGPGFTEEQARQEWDTTEYYFVKTNMTLSRLPTRI